MSQSVILDEKAVKKLTSYLEGMPKDAPKAVARAMNRAIMSTGTAAAKIITQKYTLKSKDVKQTVLIKKAKPDELTAEFQSRSDKSSLSMAHYKFSPKKDTTGSNQKPVTATVKKGSPFVVDKGFVYNGNVFRRVGKERLPIEVKTGPTVPQLLSQEDAFEELQKTTADNFMKRLDHEVEALLKGYTK